MHFCTPRAGAWRQMPEGNGRAGRYTARTMKASRLLLALIVCSVPLLAAAQWQWVDKSGHKVFSDQAPPPDVTPDRILKRPGMRASAAAEAASAPAATAAEAPKPTGKDKELEARKKAADAASAAKKKDQEEQVAQARADNCTRAKAAKATFDSGVRIVRNNEKGEREVLDDDQRAAEVKRLETLIARDCPK